MTYESVYFPESCEQGLGWTGWPVQVSNMPRVSTSKCESQTFSKKKKKQKSESQIFSKKEKKSESQNSNMGPN